MVGLALFVFLFAHWRKRPLKWYVLLVAASFTLSLATAGTWWIGLASVALWLTALGVAIGSADKAEKMAWAIFVIAFLVEGSHYFVLVLNTSA